MRKINECFILSICIAIMIVIGILTVYLVSGGFDKVIDTTQETVTATITNTYHKPSWLQPIHSGKITTYITHPAKNIVVVEYDNMEFVIDDYDCYDYCEDKIGQSVQVILEKRIYEKGNIRQNITGIMVSE